MHKIVIFYLSQISFNKSIVCCGFTDKTTASFNLMASTRNKTVGFEIYVHFALKIVSLSRKSLDNKCKHSSLLRVEKPSKATGAICHGVRKLWRNKHRLQFKAFTNFFLFFKPHFRIFVRLFRFHLPLDR